MITKNDVLLILYNDSWFSPSKAEEKITIIDKNNNKIEVPKSYYHVYGNGGVILIRVSEHGTSLNTWIRRRTDPSKSIQNLSVIFSNEPVTSKVITEPVKYTDKEGKTNLQYLYFVVEQYVYKMENLSKNDFLTFVKKLKALNEKNVFKDPFKNKPSKRAVRNVLTPQTMGKENIPSSNNPIHPRQMIVAQNKDYEVDAEGNLLKEIKKIVKQVLHEILEY